MIIKFLKELKYSHESMSKIFTEGSCFRLCLILKTIYPNAQPLYSKIDGHWITEIDGKFYDIHGEINRRFVENHAYEKWEEAEASAYATREGESGVSYLKYKESI